jgi:H+/gluconate symporter-like permease
VFIHIVTKRAERRETGFLPSGTEAKAAFPASAHKKLLPLWKCLTPSVTLLLVMNLLGRKAEVALFVAVVVSCAVFWREIPSMKRTLGRGAVNAVSVIGNPCAVVGVGSAVSAAAGYQMIVRAVDQAAGSPYLMILLASGLTAAIVGSAAGGVEITLNNFAQQFLATGISPAVIHRLWPSRRRDGFDAAHERVHQPDHDREALP